MALQTITESSVTEGLNVDLGTTDSVTVEAGVFVVSNAGDGIKGTGSNHVATINGSIYAKLIGIRLGDQPDTDVNQRLTVGEDATIGGSFIGAVVSGSNNVVTNYGRIWGGTYALDISSGLNGTSRLFNYGLIESENTALTRDGFAETGTLVIRNFGTIYGGTNLLNLGTSTAVEQIFNSGTMIGTLNLGGGNDRYDGHDGTFLGTINGGAGNDVFLPGLGAETIDGGAGNADVLDFSFGGGVKVVLNGNAPNTGRAAGDTYLNIEHVFGSAGNDQLYGNAQANQLRGRGGADRLYSGGGNDTLMGGAGKDTLAGGLGNDRFIFESKAVAGDVILDFRNVAGNDDLIRISAAGFGGGLAAGTLAANQFRSQTTNQAQDADDRFIFRTTDNTLWFDSNGNAAGGLTLVADLDAAATLTFADISIY